MKRPARKILIVLILAALGLVGWHFGLDRAGDCLLQGGRWNWDGGFCRLEGLKGFRRSPLTNPFGHEAVNFFSIRNSTFEGLKPFVVSYPNKFHYPRGNRVA